MKILATRDVDDHVLDLLRQALDLKLQVTTERGIVALMAAEAPSWVRLIAEASWWQQTLGASATLFVAELIKEAAKDSWKNRAKAISLAVVAGSKLKELAVELLSLRRRLSPKTEIVFAIPVPDDYFGTQLKLSAQDEISLQLEVALFVHHFPALTELMRTEQFVVHKPATGLFLELLPNGDLQVMWFDAKTLAQRQRVLGLLSMAS